MATPGVAAAHARIAGHRVRPATKSATMGPRWAGRRPVTAATATWRAPTAIASASGRPPRAMLWWSTMNRHSRRGGRSPV